MNYLIGIKLEKNPMTGSYELRSPCGNAGMCTCDYVQNWRVKKLAESFKMMHKLEKVYLVTKGLLTYQIIGDLSPAEYARYIKRVGREVA